MSKFTDNIDDFFNSGEKDIRLITKYLTEYIIDIKSLTDFKDIISCYVKHWDKLYYYPDKLTNIIRLGFKHCNPDDVNKVLNETLNKVQKLVVIRQNNGYKRFESFKDLYIEKLKIK